MRPHELPRDTGRAEWYAVRTRPGTEYRAAVDIASDMGFQTWMPSYRLQGERRSPLFPAYCFAEFSIGHDDWTEINHHRDVVKLLPLNSVMPMPVPRRFIEECKRREERGEFDLRGTGRLMLKYAPGAQVRITSGALRDRIVRFVTQHTDNAIVEMVLFGRAIRSTVPVGYVGDPA